jgi:hypothetical protein
MIGKYILPWFGGGPAVWTASMMFFQVLLLGGYAYAHFLSRLRLGQQGRFHLVSIALILVYVVTMAFTWATPITPNASWKPGSIDFPVWHVVLVLGISVGLPYFLLSTTSSLVQAWYGQLREQVSPYSFYILSNGASFLALLSYPILVEPYWTIHQQAGFWSGAFVVYLLLIAVCAVQAVRNAPKQHARITPEPAENQPADLKRPAGRTFLLWISLAACASVMLLATTNQMCQDIASIPFLWVMPLSIYLLSFMFAFTDWIARYRGVYVALTLVAIFLGLWSTTYGSRSAIFLQIFANSLVVFFICIFCHSELYLRRPHPHYLTSFYLALSIGGAVGGVFVNLVAPIIFKDFWEYQLGLIFCAVMIIAITYQSQGTLLHRLRIPVAVVSLSLAFFVLLIPILWVTKTEGMWRNFYGVIKLQKTDIGGVPGINMMHGAIVHGSQALSRPDSLRPTRYFTGTSGIGRAILNHPRRLAGQSLRVGVVGLGVGTLAAYAQEGDTFRFFEIDPDVIRVAEDERYFTYLSQSPGTMQVIAGDGRLSLERELSASTTAPYDILIIDAFSGDSIPTHLISHEAIDLYLALLGEDGVLAFNITNRHINLEPVLAQAGKTFHLQAGIIEDNTKDPFAADSVWVLFSQDPKFFETPAISSVQRALVPEPSIHLWTDDYSNLFQVLW